MKNNNTENLSPGRRMIKKMESRLSHYFEELLITDDQRKRSAVSSGS